MNKHFLILLATTVITAFSQCIEPGNICNSDEECCSEDCYIIPGVGGVCNTFKFNQDHFKNSKCADRGMPCHSDEECCSNLNCSQGTVEFLNSKSAIYI